MPTRHKIILLAHGSSDPKWCHTFEKLAAPTVSAVPDSVVAYMELSEPSMDQVVAQAVVDGFKTFTVLPLFLAAGRHLRKDVPAMIADLETAHDVSIQLAPPVGENPQLGLAIRDVVEQTLQASNP
ncbi:sirohydrochlorin chelatase [Marinobacter caseinilyticus]|uniref:sirohydrochlorin chelatase n=1 Tax=Marinobacter caseinilyticus TaxID=2692195 RepID=UPI001409311C|nr:CbiX/SirB N-terminal domain-containing protein [Marinobacter caseinilyticus]